MLVGQYDYAIDAKGRLNFPARFRDAMGETFIVTRWLDHCLAAFPAEEFEKVAAKIEEKGLVKGRKVSRMLYASAVEVTPDKQGRIQLPAKLREYAGLDHDVTIIGSRSFAEIWNTEAWNANQETRRRRSQQRNRQTPDHRTSDLARSGPGCGGSRHRKAQGSAGAGGAGQFP